MGSTECQKCPDGTYSLPGTDTCCPDAQTYDKDKRECVFCAQGQNCHCPQDTPYANGNGECVECLEDEHCPSGFCSKRSCCPSNSSTFFQKELLWITDVSAT